MTNQPRVGVVLLPDLSWQVARSRWQQAEQLGFHTGWTYDHLTWRTLRDGPWMGAVPLLSAVAACTTTLRIGTLVASPNFRHPVTFAKEAMSIDLISGGRFVLGFGAGGTGWDATALGQEPWSAGERTARFAEFVDHLDVLLTHPSVDRIDGAHYAARDARCLPGCVQSPRVPFALAASAPRGMAVVARQAHTWVTLGDVTGASGDSFASLLQVIRAQTVLLERACLDVGRDPAEVQRLLLLGDKATPWWASVGQFHDVLGALGSAGFTDVAVHWPRADAPYQGDEDRFVDVMSSVLASPVSSDAVLSDAVLSDAVPPLRRGSRP